MYRIEWGPWRTTGWPNLGDYIRVDSKNERTNERRIFERFVIGISNDMWFLSGFGASKDWFAIRWALGRLPGEPMTKTKEVHGSD